jgi:hypothetical protein
MDVELVMGVALVIIAGLVFWKVGLPFFRGDPPGGTGGPGGGGKGGGDHR